MGEGTNNKHTVDAWMLLQKKKSLRRSCLPQYIRAFVSGGPLLGLLRRAPRCISLSLLFSHFNSPKSLERNQASTKPSPPDLKQLPGPEKAGLAAHRPTPFYRPKSLLPSRLFLKKEEGVMLLLLLGIVMPGGKAGGGGRSSSSSERTALSSSRKEQCCAAEQDTGSSPRANPAERLLLPSC